MLNRERLMLSTRVTVPTPDFHPIEQIQWPVFLCGRCDFPAVFREFCAERSETAAAAVFRSRDVVACGLGLSARRSASTRPESQLTIRLALVCEQWADT